jgi:hypothetical protein
VRVLVLKSFFTNHYALSYLLSGNSPLSLSLLVLVPYRLTLHDCPLFISQIHTPKLIGGASEGGSNVFKLNYFDQVRRSVSVLYLHLNLCLYLKDVYWYSTRTRMNGCIVQTISTYVPLSDLLFKLTHSPLLSYLLSSLHLFIL